MYTLFVYRKYSMKTSRKTRVYKVHQLVGEKCENDTSTGERKESEVTDTILMQ